MSGTGHFKIVRAYDPAIDFDAVPKETWDDFVTTRDPALLDGFYLPGEQPVVYHCRPLSRAEARDVLSRPESERPERAFAWCVLSVDNLRGLDGSLRPQWRRPETGKVKPLTDEALSVFALDDTLHVGQAVLSRSFSAPDRPVYVPLLASCRDALTAAALRYRRRLAAQTSESSSSGESSERP